MGRRKECFRRLFSWRALSAVSDQPKIGSGSFYVADGEGVDVRELRNNDAEILQRNRPHGVRHNLGTVVSRYQRWSQLSDSNR